MGIKMGVVAAILQFGTLSNSFVPYIQNSIVSAVPYAAVVAYVNAGNIYSISTLSISVSPTGSVAPTHTTGQTSPADGLTYTFLSTVAQATYSLGITPSTGQIWINGTNMYYCQVGGNVSTTPPTGTLTTNDNGNVWVFNSVVKNWSTGIKVGVVNFQPCFVTSGGNLYMTNGGTMGATAPVATINANQASDGNILYNLCDTVVNRTVTVGMTPVAGLIYTNGTNFYVCTTGGHAETSPPVGFSPTANITVASNTLITGYKYTVTVVGSTTTTAQWQAAGVTGTPVAYTTTFVYNGTPIPGDGQVAPFSNGNVWTFYSAANTWSAGGYLQTYISQPVKAPVIGADGNGWVVMISLAGVTDPTGTVDATKLTLSVQDPGYTTTGAVTTVTRSIQGTSVIRRQIQDPLVGQLQSANLNNNVNYQINIVGGNCQILVALNDFIYSGSTIVSATLGANFYKTNTAKTAGVITNTSTLAYPLPIVGLISPQVLSSEGSNTIPSEWVAFHRHARNAQQVACVKLVATDGTNTGAVSTISTPTLSIKINNPNIPRPETWFANVDCSTLTQGAMCTVAATVYPWLGNNPYTVTNNWLTHQTPKPNNLQSFICDRTGAYGGTYAYVSPSGNDISGVVSLTAATAKATPFASTVAALNAIATFNNTNKGRRDLAGSFVRLMDNAGAAYIHYYATSATNYTTSQTWVTIENDPTNAANVSLVTSGTLPQFPDKTRFRSNGAIGKLILDTISGTYNFFGNNVATSWIMTDGCTINNSNVHISFGYWSNMWHYNNNIGSSVNLNSGGWLTTNSNTDIINILAGNYAPPANSGNNFNSSFGVACNLVVGNVFPPTETIAFGYLGGQGLWSAYFADQLDCVIAYNNKANRLVFGLAPPNLWIGNGYTGYIKGAACISHGNIYRFMSANSTPTGTTMPSHTSGTVSDGSAQWEFISVATPIATIGIAVIQNLLEMFDSAGTGQGVFICSGDGCTNGFTNGVLQYNTTIGSKTNALYNDDPNSQIAPSGLPKYASILFSNWTNINTKRDGSLGVQEGASGNWAFCYRVSSVGEVSLFGDVQQTGNQVDNLPEFSYMPMNWSKGGIANLALQLSGGVADTAYGRLLTTQQFHNCPELKGPLQGAGNVAWASGALGANSVVYSNGGVWLTTAGGTSTVAPTGTASYTTSDGIVWTYISPVSSATTFGGDYRPTLTSQFVGKVPAGFATLNYDIGGNARLNNGNGASGCWEAA